MDLRAGGAEGDDADEVMIGMYITALSVYLY